MAEPYHERPPPTIDAAHSCNARTGIAPGETVPCTIGLEDLMAIRLRGPFTDERLDVVMDGVLDGQPIPSERYEHVLVDREAGEIVLVYPGDRIRGLPRSQFVYRVLAEGGTRPLGEFRLDHTPPRLP